jgi:RNA polymerase sigma-70 factor, ECF subfamily
MGAEERRLRLEALFVAHADDVLAYARRRSDAATADDVLSEVFVVAWRRLDEVPADPVPWLLACARRVLANQRRAERRRVAFVDRLSADRLPAEAVNSDGSVELPDRVLAQALASLSERDREILLLIAWEELSIEQAATMLGCSRPTLSVRLHRARQRLASALVTDETAAPASTLEVCNE